MMQAWSDYLDGLRGVGRVISLPTRDGFGLGFHQSPTNRRIKMPTKLNLELIGVWFCVGFFTGAGWAVATWLVGRIFSAISV